MKQLTKIILKSTAQHFLKLRNDHFTFEKAPIGRTTRTSTLSVIITQVTLGFIYSVE